MIINNKENNKDGQQQHIPNEHPVRLSPPLEGLGEVSSFRYSPPFGGVALVPLSLLRATFLPTSYPFTSYVLQRI